MQFEREETLCKRHYILETIPLHFVRFFFASLPPQYQKKQGTTDFQYHTNTKERSGKYFHKKSSTD